MLVDCFKSMGMNAFIVGNDLDREAGTGLDVNMVAAGGVWPLPVALALSLLCLLELLLLFVLEGKEEEEEEMREAADDDEESEDDEPFKKLALAAATAAASA